MSKASARRRGKGTIWSLPRRHNREGVEFGSSGLGSIWCISSELGTFWLPSLCVRTFPALVGFAGSFVVLKTKAQRSAGSFVWGYSEGGWEGRRRTKISAISSDWCVDKFSAFWTDRGLIFSMSSYSIFKIGKFPNRFQGRSKKKPKRRKKKKQKTEILAN